MCDGQVGNTIATWLMENYCGDICAVVTLGESPVMLEAQQKNIPNFVFESDALLLSQLSSYEPFDIGILAWWPKIVSTNITGLAKQGFINTHPSLLPYNRGKHYNFWALVEQTPFGVSLHYVEQGIDNGDLIAQSAISYDWEDTGGTLYSKAQQSMVELFIKIYPNLRVNNVKRVPQNLADGSIHYARELDPASKIILDKKYSARELLNLLRARTFLGQPACYFEEDGEVFEVRVNMKRKSI